MGVNDNNCDSCYKNSKDALKWKVVDFVNLYYKNSASRKNSNSLSSIDEPELRDEAERLIVKNRSA